MKDFEEKVKDIVNNEIDSNSAQNQFAVSQVPFHTHNGADSPSLQFSDIRGRMDLITYTLEGTTAQTAGNYSSFFIAPFAMKISGIQEVHTTADGNTLTLYVEKLTGTTAPGAGINLMFNTFNLKGTANTVQTARLSNTVTVVQLNAGDRLGLVKTGTLSTVTNVTVTLLYSY